MKLSSIYLLAVVFGLLLVTMMPTTILSYLSSSNLNVVHAQEDPSAAPFDINDSISSQNTASQQSNDNVRLPSQEGFEVRLLASNFSEPHNIIYGPDDILWITERLGKSITMVDPQNGTILNNITVPGVHQSQGQDGLMGMVLDPNFKNNGHFYVAYTYNANNSTDELERLTKITRFTFDNNTNTIGEPIDVISGLQGSIDHNSGRLAFGLDGKLYYTIGDQGKNQLSLYCLDIEAQTLPTAGDVANQNWTAYQGKVLRMNTDGSIPEDNPVIDGVQSHIFTLGHRNPQGLTVGPDGNLYVSEHGPNSDDEVNRLQPGGNYGWPYIAGYQDDQAYRFVNWSSAGEQCPQLDTRNVTAGIEAGVSVTNESEVNLPNFVPPITTFFTVSNDYNFTDHNCGQLAYICNPTIAPSSLRLYDSDTIPGWNGTLLMPTLKGGKIYQLFLSDNKTSLSQDPIEMFQSENRYRDLAISPDGGTLYVITDSSGPVQAIGGGATTELWNPGSLLELKYIGGDNANMTSMQ
ncbi:glucose/sorbosone family PQQ-dependent dehydrogenase [Candidatus Nitrosocosmicus franklandus]|uniref:Quinoprotein glucose dehydrogenase B n=1 Tax=Candidatus Nitrosocosmicus franklandianus TaxID=1798806 RepID=A0A484IHN1_9ARCH|nr:glucose/sorbosone family PQQ-dependent dehydrogenase [Candidatus Nitrosocosmicus franklandus]VFJ14416.1 Quinoprotein glucose dehydrogenase B [Candidatus Nitrosocosmicus franklandus]